MRQEHHRRVPLPERIGQVRLSPLRNLVFEVVETLRECQERQNAGNRRQRRTLADCLDEVFQRPQVHFGLGLRKQHQPLREERQQRQQQTGGRGDHVRRPIQGGIHAQDLPERTLRRHR